MGDFHDLINEICFEKNIHLRLLLFRGFQSLLQSALLHYLHFCSGNVFSPRLKFGMDPQKRINFPALSKVYQNYAPLVPFQNKWPKYELNIWVDSFWTHVPPPPR